MTISRRRFLQGVGAVSVLVVGGGVYRAVGQGVFAAGRGPAYEAWQDWGAEPADGPLRLIQSAILAANPHNTQPWLFQVTPTQVDLYADTGRHLGAMDPYLREMHLGLGCAVENMMLTAAAIGYEAELTLENGDLALPAGKPQLEKAATIRLVPAEAQPGALYEAIPIRHTNRYNYDGDRAIEPALLADMATLAEAEESVKLFIYPQGSEAFQTFAQATIATTETIIADQAMALDSYKRLRHSWQEVQQKKDGLYIDTAGVPEPIRAVVKMLPAISQQRFDAGWLTSTQATMENTAILGFIAGRNLYDKANTLQAGRLWQRMHLWATTAGLAAQPVNQMPEVVDRDRQLDRASDVAAVMDDLTGAPAWRPTFAFRMGYPLTEAPPSARRPVSDVLL